LTGQFDAQAGLLPENYFGQLRIGR